jgi:hypothetical protein
MGLKNYKLVLLELLEEQQKLISKQDEAIKTLIIDNAEKENFINETK